MQTMNNERVHREMLRILRKYTSKPKIEANDLIAADLGIRGDDGVDVVYDLESAFGIDLAPFVESHATAMPPRWIDRLFGRSKGPLHADATVGELGAYILKQLDSPEASTR